MRTANKILIRDCIIKDCNENDENFLKLFGIFQKTLKPDMSFREFKLYYYSKKLIYIDVSFFCDNENIAGFCAAAFYLEENYTIGRAAIGVLDEYQEKAFNKQSLYEKYINYKMKEPLQPLILSAYVANPLVYAMISKYTAFINPRLTTKTTAKVIKLKDEILEKGGLKNKEIDPFVVKIHFHVNMGKSLLQRIYKSKNKYVKYYLKINPDFEKGYGVLVIISITWLNIVCTCLRFGWLGYLKKYHEIKSSWSKGEWVGKIKRPEKNHNFEGNFKDEDNEPKEKKA